MQTAVEMLHATSLHSGLINRKLLSAQILPGLILAGKLGWVVLWLQEAKASNHTSKGLVLG